MGELVNLFWDGQPLGLSQALSIKSFQSNDHAVQLWSYDQNMDVPEGVMLRDAGEIVAKDRLFRLDGGTHDGSLAFFADFFMLNLLLYHGGWWTHPDVICLKPLPELEYLFGPHWTSGVGTHIMRAPFEDRVIREARDRFLDIPRSGGYDYHAGLRMINAVVCDHNRQGNIGAAEEWWDDKPPYERFYLPSGGTPADSLYIVHMCHSVTKNFENQPLGGSFYHAQLKRYDLI